MRLAPNCEPPTGCPTVIVVTSTGTGTGAARRPGPPDVLRATGEARATVTIAGGGTVR